MYLIKPIRTEADYQAALARVNIIFHAQPANLEFDELDILTTLIENYEARQHPIQKPKEELTDLLNWLQNWYRSMCDDEWEFHAGIKLLSVSNPGWSVEISLENTPIEDLSIPFKLTQKSVDDWQGFLVEKGLFIGYGDPSKLTFLLARFKQLVKTGF